jgi:predicted metal-dependent phosphoesterase TrpH
VNRPSWRLVKPGKERLNMWRMALWVLVGAALVAPRAGTAAPRPRPRAAAVGPLAPAPGVVVPSASRRPVPADARRGVPEELLYSRLADGRLAAHYAVDGHVHSYRSPDASLHLGTILDEAARTGLDAVVITDHCTTAAAGMVEAFNRTHPDGPGPLLVLGEEAGTGSAHIGLWNLGHAVVPVARLDGLMRLVGERVPDSLCVLNHPLWRRVGGSELRPAVFDPRQAGPKLDAIEVWNAEKRFRGGVRAMIAAWEELLDRGLRPSIVSGSDAHHRGGGLGSVRTVVIATALDAASLAAAARAGRTYVSDDARVVFTVAGHGLGDTIDARPGSALDPARGAWPVVVRAFGRRGGEVRVYAGRTVVARGELPPGRPYTLAFPYDPLTRPAAERDHDGYLRVEVVRRTAAGGEEVALVSSPVYFDLGPADDFWAARPRSAEPPVGVAAAPRRPRLARGGPAPRPAP